MNDTKIAWTNHTWNAISGCSKVSDGCKFCYAATLSQKYGWTSTPWTMQNEAENVKMKPHKLNEPYKLPKESARVFTNSMSDMFHRAIPDWYRAVMFCVMLDTDWLTYQVLTKRAEDTVDWDVRFLAAIQSEEFKNFRATGAKDKRVKDALSRNWESAWGQNVWLGTSIENQATMSRLNTLRQVPAALRFISFEPLLEHVETPDLSGISWAIVGGESGEHRREFDHDWARAIRDSCLSQSIPFFFKQGSSFAPGKDRILDGRTWDEIPKQAAIPVTTHPTPSAQLTLF